MTPRADVLGLAMLAACAVPAARPPASVAFDTAAVWIRQGSDSTRLGVELATSPTQHEVGLSGRPSLDPDSGMLFVFDSRRLGGDGFQMWQTRMPLDIAFIDGEGVILRILSMEPCAAASALDCPGYYPSVEYARALEVNRGWFAAHAIDAGAVVRIEE